MSENPTPQPQLKTRDQEIAAYYGPRGNEGERKQFELPTIFWVCLVLTTIFAAVTAVSTGFLAFVLFQTIQAIQDFADSVPS
jgi:hypothetical protein